MKSTTNPEPRPAVKFVRKYWLPLSIGWLLAASLAVCSSKTTDPAYLPPATVATLTNEPGRHYTSLSVHPNSEEILFLEFTDGMPSLSHLLRYHLKTKQLKYYDLPSTHVVLDAAFSPTGNTIVMRRAPNVSGDDEVKRQAYASSEIVTMKADGKDLKTIPIPAGLKFSPVMSHDERRIAYWRATQRPEGSKSFASRFDVWEFDVTTGKEQPFAGLHEFFQGGQLQYFLSGNELITGAGFPANQQLVGRTPSNFSEWTSAYTKRFNGSEMYLLKRDQIQLSDPILTEAENARNASIDLKNNYYFGGQRPSTSFFRRTPEGQVTQWQYPWNHLGSSLDMLAVPNSSGFIFVFEYKNSPSRVSNWRGIAMFDIERGTWTQLSIPPLETATSIPTDIPTSTR